MAGLTKANIGRLDGRAAIITGGAGGIGLATAALMLAEGARVLLVDHDQSRLDAAAESLARSHESDAKGLAQSLAAEDIAAQSRRVGGVGVTEAAERAVEAEAGPVRIAVHRADVTREDEVMAYVQAALGRFGRIDAFFNNAGIEGRVAPIAEQRVEDFDQVLAVNVRGVFLGLKHVLPHMIGQGSGAIVNMSSVAGLGGSPGLAPYVASKHAVVGLTKSAALEAASAGVRVNSVHPSPVETRMMRAIEAGAAPDDAEAARDKFRASIPLGRYGEPDDVARLVLFLVSDESRFITGAQMRVDGGMGAG